MILTNAASVSAIYTARVTDPIRWDQGFTDAVTYGLAARMCFELSGKEDRVKTLSQLWQLTLNVAAAQAACEGSSFNRIYMPEAAAARGFDDGLAEDRTGLAEELRLMPALPMIQPVLCRRRALAVPLRPRRSRQVPCRLPHAAELFRASPWRRVEPARHAVRGGRRRLERAPSPDPLPVPHPAHGQSYALVFGDRSMQVVMNGGFVLDGSGDIYTLTTPYAAADLPTLKFVQSADTMTLTHPGYPPQNLTRTGHAAWSFTTLVFAPSTAAPTGLSSNHGGGGVSYVVTAINATTGEESLPSTAVGVADENSTLSWSAVAAAGSYSVYKLRGGVYGFIGTASGTGFTDSGIVADGQQHAAQPTQSLLGRRQLSILLDLLPAAPSLRRHDQRAADALVLGGWRLQQHDGFDTDQGFRRDHARLGEPAGR